MMSRCVGPSAVAVKAIRGTFGKVLVQDAQFQVFGAEIMSPLRDAMGFVDGEKRDLAAR